MRRTARSVYDVSAAFSGLSRCGNVDPLVARAVAIHEVSEPRTRHSAAFGTRLHRCGSDYGIEAAASH
jgi:hypothetical protein